MAKKELPREIVKLDRIVGGGQALGKLADGRKVFVWGGLPGEEVDVQLTKKKSSYAEGVVINVIKPSAERIEPRDHDSYLSTSPWQIMMFEAEQSYKAQLIEEAFELHGIKLQGKATVYSDDVQYEYRNKIEFSFWYDTETEQLSLAFYRRGTHGKIPVDGTSLANPAINLKATEILAALNDHKITGRTLKTLLIRCDQQGSTAWQLYVKDEDFPVDILRDIMIKDGRGEVIYSNPKSPASVITKRLTSAGRQLNDKLIDISFQYATESFFQINLPVYEQALKDIESWIPEDKPVVDLYSGVGTIGLTIGGEDVTLVEINESAVREMKRNIDALGKKAEAVLAPSEHALDYISTDKTIIVDPPRAGLHEDVIGRLLEVTPEKIIYLSCNPVTQARDVALLRDKYMIEECRGYNFFPRTPHIEHLVVLGLQK